MKIVNAIYQIPFEAAVVDGILLVVAATYGNFNRNQHWRERKKNCGRLRTINVQRCTVTSVKLYKY